VRVYVDENPVELLPGMTVRHALIGAGLIDEVAAGKKVCDAWGNEVGLDGTPAEGERLRLVPRSALANSLWNLFFRVVSTTDHSRTSWTAILRGSCLVFFKETVDDLPSADNEASRAWLKRLFFKLPEHRIYDYFEFFLADDRSGAKEVDRKLLRRGLNEILDREGAPVRLLRDRFVPLPDAQSLEAVSSAQESVSLFDDAAASRHLASAVAYLSRRPDPASAEAVREALLAVAAVVRTVARGKGEVALGTVAPAADIVKIDPALKGGIEAVLSRCHAVSGLPGAPPRGEETSFGEAAFLVAFCSSVIAYILRRE
jgi:hypothetical protein